MFESKHRQEEMIRWGTDQQTPKAIQPCLYLNRYKDISSKQLLNDILKKCAFKHIFC